MAANAFYQTTRINNNYTVQVTRNFLVPNSRK